VLIAQKIKQKIYRFRMIEQKWDRHTHRHTRPNALPAASAGDKIYTQSSTIS